MSKIRWKQVESSEFIAEIANVATGTSFDTALFDYFSNTGWVGNGVLAITGGSQFIQGQKSFGLEPFLPTGSLNLSGAASKLYVNDRVSGQLNNYSGWASGQYISKTLSEDVGGIKTFTSSPIVPFATSTGQATNLANVMQVSGVLRSGLTDIQIEGTVYTYGEQLITGKKILAAGATVSDPVEPSGIVNLRYLTGNFSVSNTVLLTGNQSISGVKTFLQSPIVPIAIASNQAINKTQFDAGLANIAVGTGSIQGVTNVNGISGSVIVEGINGISSIICSGVLYISGNAQNTNLYSLSIPLSSGITGIAFQYATGFSAKPNVVGTLEYAGQGNLQFIDDVIFNSTTGGFNVGFSTGIPSTGYYYNFDAIPTGSGFMGVKGDRGFPAYNFRQRGAWQAGVIYTPYDVVFTSPNFVSYWTTGTAISDSFNAPSGTGTSLWQILSSGTQGPTGFYIYKGVHNTGTIYNFKESVTFDGSSYVYTGSSPVSGFTPEMLTGGWGLIAAKAPLGYYINSGTVTGNFSSLSFFLSPVNTGLDLAESFVGRTFFFTGFSLGCVTTGSGPSNGGLLTGRIYVRDTGNNKIILQNFTFNSGKYHYRSGDFSQPITGEYRVGVDIRNTLSGIDKFSVGIYGFGY